MSLGTCDRCGKKLKAGTGPNTPVRTPTGETICGECLLVMLESASPALTDDPRLNAFIEKAASDIGRRARIEPSRLSFTCKRFIGYDVEIRIVDDRYSIVFIYDLISEPRRWKTSRDQIVTWIKQHPVQKRAWRTRQSAQGHLATGGRFVFIFLPDQYPAPPAQFGPQVAKELCPSTNPALIGWTVCPVSNTSESRRNEEIRATLANWANDQTDSNSLKFDYKSVRFHFATDECTCIVAYR